jgi:hypothetical protein
MLDKDDSESEVSLRDVERGVINPLGDISPSDIRSSSFEMTTGNNHFNHSQQPQQQQQQQPSSQERLVDNGETSLKYRNTLEKMTNFKLVRLVQYFCFLISLTGCLYFMQKEYINVALQYFQICFISTVTVCLDAESWYKQRLFFVLSGFVTCGWAVAWIWAGNRYLDFQLYNYISAGLCAFFFFVGMLSTTYVGLLAAAEVKYVELDLLLYLVALNAICFFSTDDKFNNNLHMILDIRTLVLLYTCLHQPKQKMELLNSTTFIVIMVLIIIVFILFSNMKNHVTNAVGNCIYAIIGILLIYEAWTSYLRFMRLVAGRGRSPTKIRI